MRIAEHMFSQDACHVHSSIDSVAVRSSAMVADMAQSCNAGLASSVRVCHVYYLVGSVAGILCSMAYTIHNDVGSE